MACDTRLVNPTKFAMRVNCVIDDWIRGVAAAGPVARL